MNKSHERWQAAPFLFLLLLAGYALAKYPDAPGHGKLSAFVLGTMLIPGTVGAFGIFWMRQYIAANVPDELMQAARIDGRGEFGIYWRIVLPVIQPALAALGIMHLIGSWNNLLWAFIVLRTPQMFTLPIVIYLLNGEERTPYGLLMAGGLLTTLPLILAFLFFQKQFISGVTAGAVKQ